ncbi:MAG: hypothetical protein J6W28_00955 [Clostridia bacterium]|nr:hypothetical protein [Clostridia bacterium]
MPRGNPQNLKPPFTPEEARTQGSKGGKASAAARRAAKTYQEAAKWLLGAQMDGTGLPDHVKAIIHALGNRTSKRDTGALFLVMSDFSKAMGGGPDSSEAMERLFRATGGGVSVSEIGKDAAAFRPDVIEILPASDTIEKEDGDEGAGA